MCGKKILAALAAVIILTSVLAGCGSKDSSVVMKLGGIDVRYDLFRFAVASERAALESKYGEDVFAGDVSDELTEELRSGVLEYLRGIYCILSLAGEYGIDPEAPAITDSVNRMRTADEEAEGGEGNFLSSIEEAGMTEDVYMFITKAGVISDELYYAMLNSGAIDSDEKNVKAFLEGDGCVRVKQILVTTENRTEERAKQIAEEARRLALDGEDFDELISRYGEDMNMFGSTQGYYLMRGVMYREFEDASFALPVDGISEVVKSPAGYSVIKRLEKDPEYMTTHFDRLAEDYYDAQYSLAREERAASLEITASELYDKTDILSVN